ncbi:MULTISPECIES: hypothetical protein [unclassified Streptomyces]|nr:MULTISPECIES: hypothetical protein [unclassified Streptomyces]
MSSQVTCDKASDAIGKAVGEADLEEVGARPCDLAELLAFGA